MRPACQKVLHRRLPADRRRKPHPPFRREEWHQLRFWLTKAAAVSVEKKKGFPVPPQRWLRYFWKGGLWPFSGYRGSAILLHFNVPSAPSSEHHWTRENPAQCQCNDAGCQHSHVIGCSAIHALTDSSLSRSLPPPITTATWTPISTALRILVSNRVSTSLHSIRKRFSPAEGFSAEF